MADSKDKSQGKKENTRDGSSNGDTITNESEGFRSVAVPLSPNQPQVSITEGDGAVGDEGEVLSGESKTKREEQGSDLHARGVDKGKTIIKNEEEPGLIWKKPNTNFDDPKVFIPCRVCGKRFSHKSFFYHLMAHPGWNEDGKFLPWAATSLAELTTEKVAELAQELPSKLLAIGWKILEQISSSGEGTSMQNNGRGQEVDLNFPEDPVHFPTPLGSDESEDDAFDLGC